VEKVCVFAFQNKFILFEKGGQPVLVGSGRSLFEKGVNSLIIMDDSFTLIGTVILSSKFPPSIIRIASSIDSEALEYIDEINMKFPLPILGNLKDYKSYNERLNSYGKNINYPLPI
jgi:hypothetical protein